MVLRGFMAVGVVISYTTVRLAPGLYPRLIIMQGTVNVRAMDFFCGTKMKRAFTLAELMLTIGLIAVLSAGMISLIGKAPQQDARDKRRMADLNLIASALELYRHDNGGYPLAGGGGTAWETVLVNGGYMTAVPTDPKTPATHYNYMPVNCTATCRSYALHATNEKPPVVVDSITVTSP
jgi:prepilin-type N-terminal cleavage/methylation domain-containing protein